MPTIVIAETPIISASVVIPAIIRSSVGITEVAIVAPTIVIPGPVATPLIPGVPIITAAVILLLVSLQSR